LDDQRPELIVHRRTARRGVLAVLIVSMSLACGGGEARFRNTFDSPEALAGSVLSALEARDEQQLWSLMLSEQEFRGDVFLEMPAYRRVPSDYVWRDLRQKSRHSLARALEAHGGRRYELQKIEFGGTSSYRSFVVFRRPRLVVRDTVTGRERSIEIFGSVLRHSGRYKLFSYVAHS
jgi:hypothetical protein